MKRPWFFISCRAFLTAVLLLPGTQASICRAAQISAPSSSPTTSVLREADPTSGDGVPNGISIRQDARAPLFSDDGQHLVIEESIWATATTPRERQGLIAFASAYQDFDGEGPAELSKMGKTFTNLVGDLAGEAAQDRMVKKRKDHRWRSRSEPTGSGAAARDPAGFQRQLSLDMEDDDDAFKPIRPSVASADGRARAQSALRAAALAGLNEKRMVAMLRRVVAQGDRSTEGAAATPTTQSQIDAQRIIRELGMLAF